MESRKEAYDVGGLLNTFKPVLPTGILSKSVKRFSWVRYEMWRAACCPADLTTPPLDSDNLIF